MRRFGFYRLIELPPELGTVLLRIETLQISFSLEMPYQNTAQGVGKSTGNQGH